MVKLKVGKESKFLNDKQTEEILELINANTASVADAGDFVQVEFTDRLIEDISMKSPFYDFLVAKNRVFPTDFAKGAFRHVEIPASGRSKFSENETASDISTSAISFEAPEYSTAIVARKIEATTMLQTGDPSFDPMDYQRQSATLDNYSAVDEGLFNTHISNKFDGIKDTTSNVFDKEGSPITLDDIDLAVQKVMDRGGIVDGIIATGGAINQLVQSDNDNQKVYANKADVILGKWATQIMTASGLVPLIPDFNINNRTQSAPDANSDAVYIIDSSAIEVDVLHESMSRVLGVQSFADAELVGTFLRMGNLNTYKNAVIKNIQSISATDMTVVFTVEKSTDNTALAGVAITITQTVNGTVIAKTITTGSDGKASVVVNSELGYSISAAKTGYTTYTHSYSAGGDSAIDLELVPST
jgi:hypothetical protein